MKALRLFLWLWLVPVFLSGLVMFLDGGFGDEILWKGVAMVVGLLAVPAFGVAFVLPFAESRTKARHMAIFWSTLVTSAIGFALSATYFYSRSEEGDLEIPLYQAIFCACFFLTQAFLTRTKHSAKKAIRFKPNAKFWKRAGFWICFPEAVFAAILLLPEFPRIVGNYALFGCFVLGYVLLTNFVAYLAVTRCLRFRQLSRPLAVIVPLATALTLFSGIVYVRNSVGGEVNINLVMLLFFPSLFSASAMAFLVNSKISSDQKDSEILKLGQSVGKKSSELEILKRQVNPHFFFNNLNMLVSLIESDPKKASEFGQRLAKVYRKFLSENSDDFVPLSKELDFISEYIEIYRARFGNSFSVSLKADANPKAHLLSDSLQEAVDNIFKHNVFEEENPIRLEIFSEDGNLIVRNSKVPKKAGFSEKTGIENIRKRYGLLTGQSVSVSETDTVFVLNLPILEAE